MRPVWRLSQGRVSILSKRQLNEQSPSICVLCQHRARQSSSQTGNSGARKPKESLIERIRRERGRGPVELDDTQKADSSEAKPENRRPRQERAPKPSHRSTIPRQTVRTGNVDTRIGAEEVPRPDQPPQSWSEAIDLRSSSLEEVPITEEPKVNRISKKKATGKVKPFRAPRLETFAPDQDPLRDFFGQVSDKEHEPATPGTECTEEIDLSSLQSARFPGNWRIVEDAKPVRESGQGLEVQRFPGGWETITSLDEDTRGTPTRRKQDVDNTTATSKSFLKGLTLVKREEPDRPYGLIVRGVNPSVKTIDFTRLSSAGLDSWKRQIKDVQQVRTLSTLDSHAAFKITFNDKDTAITYRDELLRLHRLARFKADYAPTNSLWKAIVPPVLKSTPDADPDDDLRNFTILPGSHLQIEIRKDHVMKEDQQTWSWVKQLEERLKAHGSEVYHPPTVILDVYPPAKSKEDIMKAIKSSMDPTPDMLPPMYLDPKVDRLDLTDKESRYAAMDLRAPKVNKGRLLMVFTTDIEARKFHRFFNNRIIETAGSEEECVWRTWMLEW